jgi:hypothetical protein
MRIRTRTQIALGELMKGLAVMSANDASVAAAEYVAGDVDEVRPADEREGPGAGHGVEPLP